MRQDVVIELDEDKRFLIEDPDSERIILVNKLTIMPISNQMTYRGFGFDIDYKTMSIGRKHEVEVVIDGEVNIIYEPESND